MRRALAGLVAATSVALALLPSACGSAGTSCTLVACDSTVARIDAHVPIPLAALVSARTTVCWRDVCADLVAAGADAGVAIAFDTRVSLLEGSATVAREGSGASLLHVELLFFTRGRDGNFHYTRAANGDHYRIRVVAPDGTSLFDVDRAVTYDEYTPNGPDCDPDPCRRVTLVL